MKERKKNRLVNYDYSKAGCYFITICLNDKKQHFLGDVLNGEMILSEYGKIIDKQWIWLQEQYEYVILDLYVVMPNHFHGILTINDFVGNGRDRSSDSKIKSISSLVGAFKTTSSKLIHKEGLNEFKWQKSFYDRIIRNEKEFNNIQRYIFENPVRWEFDVENGRSKISNEEYYRKIYEC